jgi:hypothetical protein
VAPWLGDNAIEGGGFGAPPANATSGVAPGGYGGPPRPNGGARVALLQLGIGDGNVEVVARFFWWIKRSQGRCLYRGNHPIVIQRDSKLILS